MLLAAVGGGRDGDKRGRRSLVFPGAAARGRVVGRRRRRSGGSLPDKQIPYNKKIYITTCVFLHNIINKSEKKQRRGLKLRGSEWEVVEERLPTP
jgi:hypothetical protein